MIFRQLGCLGAVLLLLLFVLNTQLLQVGDWFVPHSLYVLLTAQLTAINRLKFLCSWACHAGSRFRTAAWEGNF